jgi:hypothetical protein
MRPLAFIASSGLSIACDCNSGIVDEMHRLSYNPIQILSALQSSNPASHLIVKDVYNLLYKLRLDELAGLTPIEWLLKVIYLIEALLFNFTNRLYKDLKR